MILSDLTVEFFHGHWLMYGHSYVYIFKWYQCLFKCLFDIKASLLSCFSEGHDEIVECDGCGVSVHEGCYGISESQSIASTESSASTEPWFCDACKAGVKPVSGHITLFVLF